MARVLALGKGLYAATVSVGPSERSGSRSCPETTYVPGMSQSARIIVRDETGEERSFLAMSAGYPDAVGEVIAKYLREDGPEYTPNRADNEVAGDLFRLVSEAVGPDEVWFDMPNFGASYTYFVVQ